jgi:hypothetical protein
MPGAVLWAALALIAPADDPGPEALVASLRSGTPAERSGAADALEAAGLAALPALRAAASDGDPEARRRAGELIERIGTLRLLRPTTVSLDAEGVPLAEVVDSLRGQTGFNVRPTADREGRRVTVRTAGPVAFWEALDRVAAAGELRVDLPEMAWPPGTPPIRLTDAKVGATPAPVAYAGPYRVDLLSVDRHRHARQATPGTESRVVENTTATFRVVAEPGIQILMNGPLRLAEATDDRGRGLRPASTTAPGNSPSPSPFRRWDLPTVSMLTYGIPLDLPEDRGDRIVRVAGYAPIVAVVRTDEMFAIDLRDAEAAGKAFSSGGLSLTVLGLDGGPGHAVLQVAMRGVPSPYDSTDFAAGPRQTTLAPIRLRFNLDDHIAVEDDEGRRYVTASQFEGPGPGPGTVGEAKLSVQLFPDQSLGPPARLRYFGVAAVATEVPFEFADVPIP